MQNPPRLTDLTTLSRNRLRAAAAPADFLHQAAKDEFQDRLAMVNKTFTKPAIVTGFPAIWANFLPQTPVVSDSEELALKQAGHDLVIHTFGLHWANDPVGQLIQCKQALKPDGLFLTVLFGGQTLHELRTALAQAEAEVRGGLSPRVAPMAEIRDLGSLLQRAGFALPVADTLSLNASYQTIFHLMRDLRAMGETNALTGRDRHFTRRQIFDRAAEIYQKNYMAENGRIEATFELIFLTGWAPDASQPKPLRPGTATSRLSDALGVPEIPLKH